MSFSFALSESRRLFLRSLSVRSLASAVSEPRQFFVACEDCTARFALSLLWRLDNRVSSSSALSEARRIFLHCIQFYARVVVKLELRYVQRPLYIYTHIPIYRKIAARWLARAAHTVIPIQRKHAHKIETSVRYAVHETDIEGRCISLQKARRKKRHDYPDAELETERGVPHSLRSRRKIVAALKLPRPRERRKRRHDS